MDDIQEEKPSTEYAEDLFLQILDAVKSHERGMPNLKTNVMMQRTLQMIPKVCDFGLEKICQGRSNATTNKWEPRLHGKRSKYHM